MTSLTPLTPFLSRDWNRDLRPLSHPVLTHFTLICFSLLKSELDSSLYFPYKITPVPLEHIQYLNTDCALFEISNDMSDNERRHWHGTAGDRHEHHNVWMQGGAKGPSSRAPWALTPEMMANLNARKVCLHSIFYGLEFIFVIYATYICVSKFICPCGTVLIFISWLKYIHQLPIPH